MVIYFILCFVCVKKFFLTFLAEIFNNLACVPGGIVGMRGNLMSGDAMQRTGRGAVNFTVPLPILLEALLLISQQSHQPCRLKTTRYHQPF